MSTLDEVLHRKETNKSLFNQASKLQRNRYRSERKNESEIVRLSRMRLNQESGTFLHGIGVLGSEDSQTNHDHKSPLEKLMRDNSSLGKEQFSKYFSFEKEMLKSTDRMDLANFTSMPRKLNPINKSVRQNLIAIEN